MNNPELPVTQSTCPSCGYDLAGLPSEHTCPECGFDYDPASIVINLPGKGRALGNVLAGGIFCLVIIWQMMRTSRPGGSGANAWTIGLLVICIGSAFRNYMGHVVGTHRFILNRHGVHLEHPKVPKETVRWSDIRRAKYSWLGGSLYLVGQNGRILRKFKAAQLGGADIGRRCARLINDQLPMRIADRQP